jgi:tRNA U34 5-methylaminomethyl-2-thiouridine-forming methyltransferase MnmC
MRVEPAPYVFRNEDRRQRFDDRRTPSEDRRAEQPAPPRARHAVHVWFTPAFGAQILGQIAPETIIPGRARRAYAQPEARTPLRPSVVKSA